MLRSPPAARHDSCCLQEQLPLRSRLLAYKLGGPCVLPISHLRGALIVRRVDAHGFALCEVLRPSRYGPFA